MRNTLIYCMNNYKDNFYAVITPAILFAILLSATCCNFTSSENTDPVLNRFEPESKEYQNALAKQVQAEGMSNISYSFQNYYQKNGQDFIVVSMKAPHLRAQAEMLVQEWGNMKGVHAAAGGGYRGAGLRGLRYDIIQDTAGAKFIYKGVDKVID